ncbi:MAG: prepilin-type N-terminal cleavage/methylation domain-containing protein [Thermodesulfobacteriota bacterium]|nr:prepilin-type N-terminal cleavage/methylation domain-containing protein [Thermodesulfobacteriota bacterium]
MTDTLTRKSKSKGFTLLEILISLGILSIALLSVIQLQAKNLDLQTEAQFITIANLLAHDRLSNIQSQAILTDRTSSGDFGEDFPSFTFQEEISEMTDMEHLFKVRVSIILEKDNYFNDFSVETYLFREQM